MMSCERGMTVAAENSDVNQTLLHVALNRRFLVWFSRGAVFGLALKDYPSGWAEVSSDRSAAPAPTPPDSEPKVARQLRKQQIPDPKMNLSS